MALYKLDDETKEAVRVVDVDEWGAWRSHVTEQDLTLARHDIIEYKGVITAVDALKYPYHKGKVLDTVVTKLIPNRRDEYRHPWQIGVVGEDPEYAMTASTREQAKEAHKSLVNQKINAHGGRVLIRS